MRSAPMKTSPCWGEHGLGHSAARPGRACCHANSCTAQRVSGCCSDLGPPERGARLKRLYQCAGRGAPSGPADWVLLLAPCIYCCA